MHASMFTAAPFARYLIFLQSWYELFMKIIIKTTLNTPSKWYCFLVSYLL